ncbi:MAG: hypothetical protein ACRDPD_14000 [Streptosporangiaceae bacterium]
MAKLIVDGPDLVVGLSPLEKLGAFHRDVRVPLLTVRSAQAEPDPWQAVRGVRVAGTGIPRVAVLGTRYFKSGRDFVAVVASRPAIRIELSDEAPYKQLLVSVRDPESTLAEIRGATGV